MMETKVVQAPELMIPDEPGAVVLSGFTNAKVLNTNDKALAPPLIKIAQRAYTMIMPRVFVDGRSESGASFGSFSTKGPLWVSAEAGRPLPPAWSDTWPNRPTGWKVYRSPAEYKSALGIRRKRFVQSGLAANSYKVRGLGPNRVKLGPMGGRGGKGKLTNAQIMRRQARNAKHAPIALSRAEARELVQMAQTMITPQLISSAYYAKLSASWRAKLRARENALDRLRRKEQAARRKLAKERRQ